MPISAVTSRIKLKPKQSLLSIEWVESISSPSFLATLLRVPRDVGSQVAIGVAAVTQFNGRNGIIFTKKSQKGSILGRLAKDSFAGPTYNVAS
jgi:hypothetical protein